MYHPKFKLIMKIKDMKNKECKCKPCTCGKEVTCKCAEKVTKLKEKLKQLNKQIWKKDQDSTLT